MTAARVIDRPGIYEMPAEQYHSNCTPEPALAAGFGWTMQRECGLKAWASSPLNPRYEREHKAEFDVGEAAHLMFLEPELFEARVCVIDAEDYRTKAAREARDDARAAGRVPLTLSQAVMVDDMRAALRNGLEHVPSPTAPPFAARAFQGGRAELSYFWRDEETEIWCKCRPDYVLPRTLVDYKTSHTANPDELQRSAFNLGWFARAAWYLDGHKALTGEDARYWFVTQERAYPHIVEVFTLPAEALEWGRKINRAAKLEFAESLRTGVWRTYTNTTAAQGSARLLNLPAWAAYRLQDQEEAGRFRERIDPKHLAAWSEHQRPLTAAE